MKAWPADACLNMEPMERLTLTGWQDLPASVLGAALYARFPGEERAMALRTRGGGVLRLDEGVAGEDLPWELAHDGVGFLAEEGMFAWERQPAGVTLAHTLNLGRPLRMLVAWEPARPWQESAELAAACLATSLAPHLAASRVMVREAPGIAPADLAQQLQNQTWDLLVWIGQARLTVNLATLPPLVVFQATQGDDPDVIAAARQALHQGAIQALAITGVMDGPPLLAFWHGLWHGLLLATPGDLPRATALARQAMAEFSLDPPNWRGIFTFTRLQAGGTAKITRIPLLPPRDPRILNPGERLRPLHGREVFRHQVWQEVEAAFRQGCRLVGLAGPAGAGKSLTAQLLVERLHRHPELALEGRRVVWLNLGSTSGAAMLWRQLRDLFTMVGFHADPQWLSQQTHPSSIQVALMFKRLLGAEGWLVLDQCHHTHTPEGEWRDPEMGELLTALVQQSGWRCLLTSRLPFDLCRNNTACRVFWLTMPPLLWCERAALILSETGVMADQERFLAEDELLALVREGDPLPLHLLLSLHEPPPGHGPEGGTCLAHPEQRLSVLLDRLLVAAEPQSLSLLQLLAALDFAPGQAQLGGIWRVLGEQHGWQQGIHLILVGQLEALGLITTSAAGRLWLAPAIREWLTPGITPELHRDLAIFFHSHGDQIMLEIQDLMPVAEDQEGGGSLPQLMHNKIGTVLGYALRHALKQPDVELAALVFQDYLEQRGDGGCLGLLRQQAIQFITLLGQTTPTPANGMGLAAGFGVAGKAFLLVEDLPRAALAMEQALHSLPPQASPELAGGLHFQQGLYWQQCHDWEKARDALLQALAAFQQVHHRAGVASVTRALSHLTAKAAKAGTILTLEQTPKTPS